MSSRKRSTAGTTARRGGRPPRHAAGEIDERILDAATELILDHGYGATSVETIARRAGVSKRTFYHRFQDKAELFGAVVHRVVRRLRPEGEMDIFRGLGFEETLRRMAAVILGAALTPHALAIYRVILAEARRFPELAAVLNDQGTRGEAIKYIARLLETETQRGTITLSDPVFAAEQFLQMVVATPQRRALGLGAAMTAAELQRWAESAVDLFLRGCRVRGQ